VGRAARELESELTREGFSMGEEIEDTLPHDV
jgi:hypothetical protein